MKTQPSSVAEAQVLRNNQLILSRATIWFRNLDSALWCVNRMFFMDWEWEDDFPPRIGPFHVYFYFGGQPFFIGELEAGLNIGKQIWIRWVALKYWNRISLSGLAKHTISWNFWLSKSVSSSVFIYESCR